MRQLYELAMTVLIVALLFFVVQGGIDSLARMSAKSNAPFMQAPAPTAWPQQPDRPIPPRNIP